MGMDGFGEMVKPDQIIQKLNHKLIYNDKKSDSTRKNESFHKTQRKKPKKN